MLPWSFSEEVAAEKHMAQLQHNMLVAGTRKSVLSIINGGGKWIELSVEADPIYQTILIAAEKAFWRAVKTGEPPALFDCEPPKPRIEAVRVVGDDVTATKLAVDRQIEHGKVASVAFDLEFSSDRPDEFGSQRRLRPAQLALGPRHAPMGCGGRIHLILHRSGRGETISDIDLIRVRREWEKF